jgi:hypothetical protein
MLKTPKKEKKYDRSHFKPELKKEIINQLTNNNPEDSKDNGSNQKYNKIPISLDNYCNDFFKETKNDINENCDLLNKDFDINDIDFFSDMQPKQKISIMNDINNATKKLNFNSFFSQGDWEDFQQKKDKF